MDDAYISNQKALAQSMRRKQPGGGSSQYPSPPDEYVFRPPSSLEEAEERLRELKREEAYLMDQMVGVPPRQY